MGRNKPRAPRVAMIATPDETTPALVRYLADSGFDVCACDELVVARSFDAVVWISRHDTPVDAVLGRVRSWIKSTRNQRVVVITAKPNAFKDLVARYATRLCVLPAPAFGWDLVDALRANERPGSRGA
jgi:hypothetical protein